MRQSDVEKGARKLRFGGFYAVANGWERGAHDVEWVIEHVRKSIPKRNEEGVRRAERVLTYFESLRDV